MGGICYIFGAGEYGGDCPAADALQQGFVIAADGGYAYLRQHGLAVDLAVGDFDSLNYVPTGPEVVRHPVMKDDTDMLLAVKEGFRRGFHRFVLYGGLGGRLDHSIANLQVLTYIAQRGGTGFLVGKDTVVTAVSGRALAFSAQYRGTISVFCCSGAAAGVCLSGLKYPLEGARLTSGLPLGVSNAFTGQPARVSAETGVLTVLWEYQPSLALPWPETGEKSI